MKKPEMVRLLNQATSLNDSAQMPPGFFLHALNVALLSQNYANLLREEGTEVTPSLVYTAGYLHDIGKCFYAAYRRGYDFHEYIGWRFFELKGETRIADITRRHGFSFEKLKYLSKDDLEDITPNEEDFKPITIESRIVTFADMCIDENGQLIQWDEKLDKIYHRHYQKYPDIKEGIKRLEQLCLEFQKLL